MEKLGMVLRCLYSDEGLCTGTRSLVLTVRAKSHWLPDWSRRAVLPLRELVPTTMCNSVLLLCFCTLLCSQTIFLDGEQPTKRGTEQGNFTLAFDLHQRRGGSSLYPALQGA